MTFSFRALLLGGFVSTLPLRAVYAPVPEPEQGKDLIVTVKAGLSHDSNVFGSAVNPIDSTIWTLAPRAVYNTSLTEQTFLSAAYGLTLDQFKSRPGDKLLDSHDASVRLAHSFSPVTVLDVNNALTVSRNPESLLAGQPVNTDQSFTRNQLDGRFISQVQPKIGVTLKARSLYYDYRNAALGRSLDRVENLYGLAGDHAFLPQTKLVAEYRYQDVSYRTQGELKDKTSHYIMAGADYAVAKRMSLSGRFGAEWRQRAGEADTTAPYVEVSGKLDYTQRSFVSAGYVYTIDETSDTLRFNDSRLHRFFTNVQHAVSALTVASASVTFEPARLQGRHGQADISEEAWRLGAAFSYLPTRNWTLSAHVDYDRVRSDDPFRKLRRERVGLSATFTF